MMRDRKGRFVNKKEYPCPKCGGSMVPNGVKSVFHSYCWFKCGDCGYLDKYVDKEKYYDIR